MSPHSKPTPEELGAWRRAYREIAPDVDTRVDCPDDEDLAALVVDDLVPRVRAELADHVAGCERCRERWRLLRDLHREAGGTAGLRAAPRGRVRWALAAAAAVVLAAAVALAAAWLAPFADGPADRTVLRGEDGADALLTRDVVEPAPDATLASAPRRLVWPPEADPQEDVLVRLLDAEGRVLWRQQGTDGAADLPEAVRSELVPGDSYFWVVDQATNRLGPFWFTLAP